MTVEPNYVDFGSGKAGDLIERQLVIHNWTTNPIQIVGGTADCSCTVIRDLPVIVPSRDQATLTILMRVPDSKPGTLTRQAKLWSNQDKNATVSFRIGCRIVGLDSP